MHALLKSRSVNTEPFIRRCWKPSSAAWTIEVKPAPSFTKTGLESTEHVVGFGNVVETISKNTIQMFDNTRRETDGTERGDFTWRFSSFE